MTSSAFISLDEIRPSLVIALIHGPIGSTHIAAQVDGPSFFDPCLKSTCSGSQWAGRAGKMCAETSVDAVIG